MKIKHLLIVLFLSIGLGLATVSMSGCAAGGHIGPVGAGGYIG
jgi:hypothetical protein